MTVVWKCRTCEHDGICAPDCPLAPWNMDIFKFIAKYRDEHGLPSMEVERQIVLDNLAEALRKEMEIDYLGEEYRTDFTVSGMAPFPVDMLRYCCAWPADESDVRAIEDSIDVANGDDPFVIRLTKKHRDPKPDLAEDRWRSKFRWKVVTASVETRKL